MKNRIITLIFIMLFTTMSNIGTAFATTDFVTTAFVTTAFATTDFSTIEIGGQAQAGAEPSASNFTGTIEHIFFHPLIAYDKKAFDGDSKESFMQDWFITVKEFNRVIDELYRRDFVLVNVNDVYKVQVVNGKSTFVRQPIMLPKGKKPLIISIDDVNYYKTMVQNGTVNNLRVDKYGGICTTSFDMNKKVVISYDNEIIPILNSFVQRHPDFSHNNARGIIAITGYKGILGYNTTPKSPNCDAERRIAKEVVAALKNQGWTFASHSYAHKDLSKISLEDLKYDTERWANEVGAIVGYTPVYIYPFGSPILKESAQFKYLQQQGFRMFCAIEPHSFERIYNGAVLSYRRNIDGVTLKNNRNGFLDLYDSNTILDKPARAHKK